MLTVRGDGVFCQGNRTTGNTSAKNNDNRVRCYHRKKAVNLKKSVKNSVNGTRIRCYFPKKEELKLIDLFENSVNGTQGTLLFSLGRGRTENTE